MKRLSRVLAEAAPEWEVDHGKVLLHWCPGCKRLHPINIEKPNHCNAIWKWNGNVDAPSFSPSINIVGQCHYIITNGQIAFCADSRHQLAGISVPLPDLPEDV